MTNKINWLAVLAAVVVGMGIGFLWYGAFFNDLWMSGNGITSDASGDNMYKDGELVPLTFTPMIVNILAMIAYTLILNWLVVKTNNLGWAKGAMLGALVGLVPTINMLTVHLFAVNPKSLIMIDCSYTIVLFTCLGAIVGGLRKK